MTSSDAPPRWTREAYGELYRLYVDRIHRYIAYQVSDRILAEDLTNQVFLRAMQAIGRYEHRLSSLSSTAGFTGIAKNVVVDNWRATRSTVPLDEALVAERGETLDAHFESLARPRGAAGGDAVADRRPAAGPELPVCPGHEPPRDRPAHEP